MTAKEPYILVVDDDVDTCRNLSDILTDFGFRVDTAHNGPSALALVRKNAYDVALLDFKMPGMDGLTLYREIKRLQASTVAIIITAYASHGTEAAARDAGTWKILAKPVDLAQLLPLVDEAVRQPLVMVVDDDHDLCSSLWDLFRERGYRVGLAHTPAEAEAQLKVKDHCVVLLDMKLPGGDGGDVFHAVRATNPEARTILITGHGVELQQVIAQVLAEGADAVCYKPFNLDQLLATLQRLAGSQEPAH